MGLSVVVAVIMRQHLTWQTVFGAVHDSSTDVETPMQDGINTGWMFEPWIEFNNNNQFLFES
jgi:hypothetical protein